MRVLKRVCGDTISTGKRGRLDMNAVIYIHRINCNSFGGKEMSSWMTGSVRSSQKHLNLWSNVNMRFKFTGRIQVPVSARIAIDSCVLVNELHHGVNDKLLIVIKMTFSQIHKLTVKSLHVRCSFSVYSLDLSGGMCILVAERLKTTHRD